MLFKDLRPHILVLTISFCFREGYASIPQGHLTYLAPELMRKLTRKGCVLSPDERNTEHSNVYAYRWVSFHIDFHGVACSLEGTSPHCRNFSADQELTLGILKQMRKMGQFIQGAFRKTSTPKILQGVLNSMPPGMRPKFHAEERYKNATPTWVGKFVLEWII